MRSGLLRKLSLMEQGQKQTAAQKPEPPQSKLKIYEWSCPANEGLKSLNRDALLTMGFTGERFDIEKVVFLDTETNGLSGGAGTVAFLVGVGFVSNGRFNVKQYLMPDYSVEPDLLSELGRDMSRFETIVHFNGRRFDVPLLSQRCVMKRMDDFTKDMWQLDLLYPSRSVWKLRLGCCRLSYLESHVLGMPDRDDIPGSEIPARYMQSVRSGDVSLLSDVVEHNRQDIATLMTLLVRLNEIYTEPEELNEQIDIFSMGRVFERQGEYRVARKLYLKASKPRPIMTLSDLRGEKYAGEANLRLYLIQRRAREYDKCEQTLKNMLKRGQMGETPRLELCKLYEHRLGRLDDALEQCSLLISKASEDELPELEKRRNRILYKISRRVGNQ